MGFVARSSGFTVTSENGILKKKCSKLYEYNQHTRYSEFLNDKCARFRNCRTCGSLENLLQFDEINVARIRRVAYF